MIMFNFFHRLFNPHCEHCREKEELDAHCETCEVLKQELAFLRQERNILLDKLLNKDIVDQSADKEVDLENFKSLRPTHVPWAVRKQMLENEDRQQAKLMRDKKKEIPQVKTEGVQLTVKEMESVIGEDDAVSGSNAQV